MCFEKSIQTTVKPRILIFLTIYGVIFKYSEYGRDLM